MTDFEKRLEAWLATEAQRGEERGHQVRMLGAFQRARGRPTSVRRTALGTSLVAIVIVAVLALARVPASSPPAGAESTPDPSAPAMSDGSAQASDAPAQPLPAAATALLEETVIAMVDPRPEGGGSWLLGTLRGEWQKLPYTQKDAAIRTDWNRIIVTRQTPEGVAIEELLADGSVRPLLTEDARAADVRAAAGRTPAVAVIYGVALGVRVLDEASGKTTEMAPPAPTDTEPVQRIRLLWSPSGHTVASPLCTTNTCQTDVIDLVTMSSHRLDNFVPLAITDSLVVGYGSEEDRTWRVLDWTSGSDAKLGDTTISAPYDAASLADDRFLLSGEAGDGAGIRFVVIDTGSGAVTPIFEEKSGELVLYPRWRSDAFAVIGPRAGLGAAAATNGAFRLIGLAEKALIGDAEIFPALP